jgi:hypothetical protein
MPFGREIRFGTSFYSKNLMSLQCHRMFVENEYGVRVVIEPHEFQSKKNDSYSIDIYGRDEDRVVKAFINIVNTFPKSFKGENTSALFSTSITTFEGILDDPRSFGMGFTWFC